MSTRASIAFVDNGAIHIFTDSNDDNPEVVYVAISGTFTAESLIGTETATTRARLAEACRAYLADHERHMAWRATQR